MKLLYLPAATRSPKPVWCRYASNRFALAQGCVDPLAHHVLLVERVLDEKENFDLIHFHIDYLHFPRTQNEDVVTLTTLHGRLDIPDLAPLYQRFRDVPVVSISDSQREPLPWLNWQRTVYHGLPSGA